MYSRIKESAAYKSYLRKGKDLLELPPYAENGNGEVVVYPCERFCRIEGCTHTLPLKALRKHIARHGKVPEKGTPYINREDVVEAIAFYDSLKDKRTTLMRQNTASITSHIEGTRGTMAETETNEDATLPADSPHKLADTDFGEESPIAHELPGFSKEAKESRKTSVSTDRILSDQEMARLCNRQLCSDLSRADSISEATMQPVGSIALPKCEGIFLLHVIFFTFFIVVFLLDYLVF